MKLPKRRMVRECLDFVVTEIERIHALSSDRAAYIEDLKNDGWLYEISMPNRRKVRIGKEAYYRLGALAREIIGADERLRGRVGGDSYLKILNEELGITLFSGVDVDDLEFIRRCSDRVVSEVLVEREYYIPCLAPVFRNMVSFRIGPVTFIDKKVFYRTRSADVVADKYLKLSEFQDMYDVQNWIACIRISGFDAEKCRERAYLSVRLAIAAIKSRLDWKLARWLGNEKQSMPKLTRFSLHGEPLSDAPERISCTWSRQYILNGSNKEVEWLLSHSSRDWFCLVGIFLGDIKDKGEWSFISSKIVTALVWLDIGNSPISAAERIVAFSNCLEALFVTSEQGIKRQIVLRSKLILESCGWRDDCHDKVEEFYSKRGEIVHGVVMPLNADLEAAASIGKYLTDVCVEAFLHFSYWLLSRHRSLRTPEHERPFNGRGSFARALEQELPVFLAEMKLATQDA